VGGSEGAPSEEDLVSGGLSSLGLLLLRMAITRDVVRILVVNEDDKDNVGVAGTPNGDGDNIMMSQLVESCVEKGS
jgi:hypothetical protein